MKSDGPLFIYGLNFNPEIQYLYQNFGMFFFFLMYENKTFYLISNKFDQKFWYRSIISKFKQQKYIDSESVKHVNYAVIRF